MGRRVDVPLVIGFTWGCLSVDLRCVQWREGCRFGDFLVRCPVFCDYWFFYSVCLFVCLFFFSYQRLFNILLSWQHVPMPVIRFRIWRKFICIKSPWETHDSGPCLNGSSIINNLFMFCLWKISAVDKHVFWCHFQMYDDYLSCCCFWKIKDSWFLIPDSWFYATSSFLHHLVAIGEFKLELQSGNAQSGSNSTIFRAVRPWNLTDDLAKQ